MARFVRRHHALLIAIAVYNFVFFFPMLFMGRVVSPNDVFYNFEPWAQSRTVELPYIQNSLLNDPPTAYLPLMSLLKDEPRAFHWNPYIGSGIPGFGSTAAAVLSPFIAFPVLALPMAWVYTAIIFLKLNVALLFAYAWLREERLGKRGAAIGAVIVAGAGIYAVRWLWQITNATALYPALLWLVRRMFNGRRNSIAVMALIALAYALSGFPAAMAYGAYLVIAYTAFLFLQRRPPVLELVKGFAAVALALLIASPSLVPFAQLLRRSGYLAMRETASLNNFYPAAHWRAFVDPDRVGNPAYRNWWGDPNLGMLNNYVEATIFLGVLTIPLALIGLLHRRARSRWFWAAITLLLLASIFGYTNLLGRLPGFKYSALTRVALLLPIAAGYLAGAGGARIAAWLKWRIVRGVVMGAILAGIAFELALFAGRFHPYLEPEATRVPSTPTIEFLQRDAKPFRVAPFFIYLWPNSSELFRIEDVRSHFGSEADYRRLLQRIDPSSWSGRSTVIQFNSLQFRFDDPLLGMLGVRYLIEQNAIDIVKWKIFETTEAAVKEIPGGTTLGFNQMLERTIPVDSEPFWAIELPMAIEEARGPGVELTLLKGGTPVWERIYSVSDVAVMNKLYVPLRPYARRGETVTLRVRSMGIRAFLGRGENVIPGEAPIFYGRVQTPIIFDRQLPDGRLFRNVAELPRFWPVQRLVKFNDGEFLQARFDFAQEAVITDDAAQPPAVGTNDARVTLTSYAPDSQRLVTESSAPFFLSSSEKLTPELAVTIDGKRVTPVEINLLFAGVTVPAGKHEVVFTRRIGRGWWWPAGAGGVVLVAIAVMELLRSRRAWRSPNPRVSVPSPPAGGEG